MLSRRFTQCILGLVFLGTSSFALSDTEFSYNFIEGGIEVTGCADTCPSDVVIPDTIDGYSVTRIGEDAFSSNQLTSVIIPDSVTSIGDGAFYGNQLTSVTIPDSANSIWDWTFAGNQLTSVTIGNGVTVLGVRAFYDNQLTSVTIGNKVTSIGSSAFESNQLTGVTIPDSVTSIRNDAFHGNQLTSVTFLGDRPEISSTAFLNNSLSSISYCDGAAGWPGDAIEGITPQLDETCDTSTETIAYSVFDIDKNGDVDALTDGLIILRYLFGLRGESLVDGAIGANSLRATATDIEAYLEPHMP